MESEQAHDMAINQARIELVREHHDLSLLFSEHVDSRDRLSGAPKDRYDCSTVWCRCWYIYCPSGHDAVSQVEVWWLSDLRDGSTRRLKGGSGEEVAILRCHHDEYIGNMLFTSK